MVDSKRKTHYFWLVRCLPLISQQKIKIVYGLSSQYRIEIIYDNMFMLLKKGIAKIGAKRTARNNFRLRDFMPARSSIRCLIISRQIGAFGR